MPRSIITKAGQTISGLAASYLKDPSHFRSLADENGWNPLSDVPLPLNVPAIIPDLEDMRIAATSRLDGLRAIAARKNNLSGRLSGYTSGIVANADMPSEYNGYSQAALSAIAEINGALDGAVSTLEEAIAIGKTERSISQARKYGDRTVRLVDWLLT